MSDHAIPRAFQNLLSRLRANLYSRDVYYHGRLWDALESWLREAANERHRLVQWVGTSFSDVVVIDVGLAAQSNIEIKFDDLLRVIARSMTSQLELSLDPDALHPEEVAQLLKDRQQVLFCFLAVSLLGRSDVIRLRGLGFTQTDHRILFCGPSDVLATKAIRAADSFRDMGEEEDEDAHQDDGLAAINPDSERVLEKDEAEEALFLVVVHSSDSSDPLAKKYRLVGDELTLGRAHANDISVENGVASRKHCKLHRLHHGYEVEDLGSTNGTWVERRPAPTVLRFNEHLRVGGLLLRLVREAEIGPVIEQLMTTDVVTDLKNYAYARKAHESRPREQDQFAVYWRIRRFDELVKQCGVAKGDWLLAELADRLKIELGSRAGDLGHISSGQFLLFVYSLPTALELSDSVGRRVTAAPFLGATGQGIKVRVDSIVTLSSLESSFAALVQKLKLKVDQPRTTEH